jgi:hypothetical protein
MWNYWYIEWLGMLVQLLLDDNAYEEKLNKFIIIIVIIIIKKENLNLAKIKMGCFVDSGTTATTRALFGLNVAYNYLNNSLYGINSQENCNKFCKSKKFLYSGTENG